MEKIKSLLKTFLASLCWRVLQWTSEPVKTKSQGLPDLSPTDDAENVEEYLDRLDELLTNRGHSVREIAITAPYSGGKSSLINTFIRRNRFHKYTCISLTAFSNSDPKTEVDTSLDPEDLNKIEKSIVQQILYKNDSAKTPNSRFRRIYPKPLSYSHSIVFAVSISVWASIVFLGIVTPDYSIDSIFLTAIKTQSVINPYLWSLVFLFALPMLLIRDCYRGIHKARITKLNLIKAEIEFEEGTKDSVFNIYLEEIIYYFHITKSDVVFFEDLDRFKSPEIYIKLKELNKLVNDSADVEQDVRFIYALRDDVFEGKNRTKFFDSIIPVIPVVNKTNSYPQIRKIIVSAGFENDLSDSFLRDIAVYIDDMRLIKNIVAEYGIYRNTLKASLDSILPSKLFSFIIYKNMYCDDFAKLHDDEGDLFGVFDRVKNVKADRAESLISDIKSFERELIEADGELTQSLSELNAYYILTFLKKISPNVAVQKIDNKNIYEVLQPEVFDKIAAGTTALTYTPQQQQARRAPIAFDSLMDEMSPPYSVRRKRIEDKGHKRQQQLKRSILNTNQQLSSNKTLSLQELCAEEQRDSVFSKVTDKPLLIHMIEKGYIDEHYHLYITHFIEGNMTRGDMDFVMSVKSRNPTDWDKSINNCEETLKYLSEQEFKSPAFFNHDIFSHLLKISDFAPLKAFIRQVLSRREDSLAMIKDSFISLQYKDRWLEVLSGEWEDIFSEIVSSAELTSEDKSELLIAMLGELREFNVIPSKSIGTLRSFINESDHVAEFFPLKPDARDRLFSGFSFIGVSFSDLSKSTEQPVFVEYALAFETFEITGKNISAILKSIGKAEYANSLDYSKLILIENVDFKSFIENRLGSIAVLVAEGEIGVSDSSDLLVLINDEKIELNIRKSLIGSVDFIVEDIDDLASNDEIFKSLLEAGRIAPRWSNVFGLYESDVVGEAEISAFISKDEVASNLCNVDREFDDSALSALRNTIAEEQFSMEAFKSYCNYLKPIYPDSKFREIGREKLAYLIENQLVSNDFEAFRELSDIDRKLSIVFLAVNFSGFVDVDGRLSIEIELFSEDFYGLLSIGKLSLEQKRTLIKSRIDLIDPEFEADTIAIGLVPETVLPYNADIDIPQIPITKLLPLIESIGDVDLKKQVVTWQVKFLLHEDIPTALRLLGVDGRSIARGGGYALLAKTDTNEALAKALEKNGYISSVTQKKAAMFFQDQIRINFKK